MWQSLCLISFSFINKFSLAFPKTKLQDIEICVRNHLGIVFWCNNKDEDKGLYVNMHSFLINPIIFCVYMDKIQKRGINGMIH
jgi:hypothetical protein